MLPMIRETLSHGIIIAAQSQTDADRFLALGASPERTCVMGNIKFDVETDPETGGAGKAMRARLFGERRIWIAASTHEGEEERILEAHRALRQRHADLVLVLVPRHPQRFAVVRELIEKLGFSVVSRSENRPIDDKTEVFLCDTMGEVPVFYAASDVAFVAGSLVPIGGHNLLEPAAQGVPVVTGPHNFNAQDVADLFVERDACRIVQDRDELVSTVDALLTDPDEARRIGGNGRRLLEDNRGALQRLIVLLEPLLGTGQPGSGT